MNDDTYEKVRDPLKRYIARCPVCGSDAAQVRGERNCRRNVQ